jgi:hypothetical protein
MPTAALLCAITFFVVISFSLAFLLFILRLPMYHPLILFSVYFFLGYCLAAASIWWNGGSYLWEYTGILPDSFDVLYAGALATLGYLSFTFMPFLLTPARRIPLRIEPVTFVIDSPATFWLTFAILTILGIVSTKLAFFDANSLAVTIDDQGGQRLVNVSGYQTLAADFLPVLGVLSVLVLRRISVAFIFLSAFVAVRMYIGSGRSSFVAAIIGMLVAIMIRKGFRRIRISHLVILILLAVVFDWLGTNRLAFQEWLFPDQVTASELMSSNENINWTSVRASSPLSDTYDFASFTMVSKIVPDLTGFNWGSQYLEGLIWPIPRQLWPDKPIYTSQINFLSSGNFFGQSISSMGDAYTNFGLVSLVLLMGAIGTCSCKLYQAAANSRSALMLMSFVIGAMYAPILFRSSIIQFEYFFLASFLCVYTLFKLGRVRIK